MNQGTFGRGRGFRPRGTRATASSFGRARFRPPFRHAGPPRPGPGPGPGPGLGPGSTPSAIFRPWQQNNMFFQPRMSRGGNSAQFRPSGRRKNFYSYNARLPIPGRLPMSHPDYLEDIVVPPDFNRLQIGSNQTDTMPQLPLPGSVEEQQQKIIETADRLKQKLSCFSNDEITDIWSDEKPANVADGDCTNGKSVATLRCQAELNLTASNDLKDIRKTNPDNSRLDGTKYTSNITSNTSSDMVRLKENENESNLEAIPNNQMASLSVEHKYLDIDNQLHGPINNFHNLEQSELHKDNNVESELLDSDVQCQFNTPLVNTLQDYCDQRQDISQRNEVIHHTGAMLEQEVFKTASLQDIPVSTNLTGQDILHSNASQSEQKSMTKNLEVQKNILEPQVSAISSADNQVSKVKKTPFHSKPPKLSPHMEQGELPIDFDPSTPPPILLKQDQPPVKPPPLIPEVLQLFNPTEPPPNIRSLSISTIPKGKKISTWNDINVPNQVPVIYNNREMHTDVNGRFVSQQLLLNSPDNVFLPLHVDTIQFPPLFPMPLGNHPIISPNVPSHAIFPVHAMSHNTCATSPQEQLLPLPDCDANKDDGLNDMQEALMFAKQMANIEKRNKENSTSHCESSTTTNSAVSNIESISLPPGEPKTKINTLKRTKRKIHSKKTSQERRESDHLPLEETIVQDTNTRSTDTSVMNEQERPKVIFNLNNKTKMVNAGWRESSEKKNGIMQFVEFEKAPVSKKGIECTSLKRNEEERKNLKRNENDSESTAASKSVANQNIASSYRKIQKKNENDSESTAASKSVANQNTASSYRKIQKNANTEKSHSNALLSLKANTVQKSCVEKNESSNAEASWKNKIISRFLKMSKNDIYNMVNNTSLRKFDVIMKRLVKEKRSTLSLEMRHAENEKMKLYDQQEFMKQLTAMLEPDATVSVTDLPTEFIHHLNEVLQLDVQRDLEDANHVLSPVTPFISEHAAASNYTSQKCERNKSHMAKTGHDRDAHHPTTSKDFNFKDDTCSTVVSNKSNISSKLSALQHDLDDIFSEVTRKNQIPAAAKERRHSNVDQRSAKKPDDGANARNEENNALLEEDRMYRSENSTHWIERYDRKRKEWEDPYAYRNLTKEEWEAKYGIQGNSIPLPSLTKKINPTSKNTSYRGRVRKSHPRRRHSSESSKHPTTRHRSLEKNKHRKSRRHSDDRRHSAGYSEYNNDDTSSSSNSSSSSSNNSNSSSNDSGNEEPNVTMLLRAIKEKEKVAKKMSLNETIRDEVNAEIERERKQKPRKCQKKKPRKEKKLHKKKKKQSKKASSSDSSSDNEETTRLLTESEIKKEFEENQIIQEVIVKEELNISQENSRDGKFVNNSSHVVIENKTAYSLPESSNKLASVVSATQETPLTIVNPSHTEDRLPTVSPTQMKTKAQLKQMPETADTSDYNKTLIPKVFTTLPEDWDKLAENLNKSRQKTDVNCNRDETEAPSTIDNSSNVKNSENHVTSRPLNEIMFTSSDSFINVARIKNDTDISANAPEKTAISIATASTSTVMSGIPISTNTTNRKSRETSKKIDIKTYYERTKIQRCMNEQVESKKVSKNLKTQDSSFKSKVEPEIPISKPAYPFTYDGSIQDPRLLSRLVIPCSANNKNNDVAQRSLRNNVCQEDGQAMKTSEVAKKPVEDSNRVVDAGSSVEKNHQETSKDKSTTANTDKKLQNKDSDSKRFKNIRSEGSKELKLKKETTQKKKKKPSVKSISLISTNISLPLKKKMTKKEDAKKKTQEEETDTSKIKIEQTAISHESRIINNYASTIFPANINNNNESTPSFGKKISEENFSSLECVKQDVLDIESNQMIRNEEEINTARFEIANKESQNVKETSDTKLDTLAVSVKASDNIKIVEENFSEQSKANTKDSELSLKNYVENSDNQDLSENNPVLADAIPELNMASRSDIIDDQLLINTVEINNVEINNKENSMVALEDGANSLPGKITEPSSVSNENFAEQQDTRNSGNSSTRSADSPFKGFLQETLLDFEQPDLFTLELHGLDVATSNKDKLFLNDCAVNCTTNINENHDNEKEESKLARRETYETLRECDMSISENFNLTFDGTLSSNKEREAETTGEKSEFAVDKSARGETLLEKPSCEIIADTLHVDDHLDASETSKRLITCDDASALTIKESMFISEEEEIIQEGPKDLASKLTSTSDPSLADTLDDAANSDDALRVAENTTNTELNLNGHNIYLEPTEKISCDKLPGFDSDEHLFYLDDRLHQSEVSFSVDRETRYDIVPVPANLPSHDELQEEQYKFDELKHISSTDNSDLLPEASTSKVDRSPVVPTDTPTPRTLNIPTKAALKEAVTNLFLTSNSLPINEVPEKTQESNTTSISQQTPTTCKWHVDVHNNDIKTSSFDTHSMDCANVNTISTQKNTDKNDERAHKDASAEQSKSVIKSYVHIEKCLHNSDMQRNPVVELEKMKELERMISERSRQEGTRDIVYKDGGKRNGTILHKLKDKRQMKYRAGRMDLNRNSLARKLKSVKKQFTFGSKEAILNRMLEIDRIMLELTKEKLKLHEILQSNTLSSESAVVSSSATRENDGIFEQGEVVSTQNIKVNRAKRKKQSSKSSTIKRRRSRHPEDDEEITRYTQKTKTPVIRWKKPPRLEEMINRRGKDLEEDLEEVKDPDDATEQQTSTSKEAGVSSILDVPEEMVIQKPESNALEDTTQNLESTTTIDPPQVQETIAETEGKPAECDVIGDEFLKPAKTCLDKTADNPVEDCAESEPMKKQVDSDVSAPSKAVKINSQPARTQSRSTSESLSIYSDDSTWDTFVPNTTLETIHDSRKVTGLALLDEKLKEEQAKTQKLKKVAIVRRKKKQQLDNYLKSVNKLTLEEENLPLSKLYIKKLRQQRDLLDSLSQKKEEDTNVENPEILKNVDEVINAVAENRVGDLYEERNGSNDTPTTSNSRASKPEEHKFYVDVEANANSDWPCREKENIEEPAEQQRRDSNDVLAADESNHVFKVVSQSKIPFYDERNVEPDSSVTPQETPIESHPLDSECIEVPPKDLNNVAISRNFDIKVSVPKILIKDDFSLELLQKFKDTKGTVGTGPVDSTTNVFVTNAENSSKKTDKDTSPIQIREEDKREEESETNLINEKKSKQVEMSIDEQYNELQKDEAINNVKDTSQLNTAYSDMTENEDTGDSVAPKDKVAEINVTPDSDSSIVEKVDTNEKKLNVESEQLSCDAIVILEREDHEDANAKEKGDNPENGSRVFEMVLDNDQNTCSSVSIDRASEKSEESNMSVDQKSSLEQTSGATSTFSLDKVAMKSVETSKTRSRRKSGSYLVVPVRRSTRYTSENVKPNKLNEDDSNSNTSEQEPNVQEKDPMTQRRSSRSRSPTSWTVRDEKILNVRRNRAAQKTQNTAGKKVMFATDCEVKIENPVKLRLSMESATLKNKMAKKRKCSEEWEMMNCKVLLVDCKNTLLKENVSSEVLNSLGITAINSYVSSDKFFMQHAISDQNTTAIPAAVSEQSSCLLSEKSSDKKNTGIKILEEKLPKKSDEDDSVKKIALMKIDQQEDVAKMQFTAHTGPILDIKIFENSFLAASEDGQIYRYSQTSSEILNIYKGHKSAVTCLNIYKLEVASANKELLYSGSLDGTLRCYNIKTSDPVKNPVSINSPIQCMDQAWGMLFIGTKSGQVSRFHIKASNIKGNNIVFSEYPVLALKATNEGPRKILIVASRNQPVTIRDAQTGLFLRTISGQKNYTVYSLMRHNNLIYCGTSTKSINVFDFTTGEQISQYNAGVGIVCMQFCGPLLFAGCYNGYIYVFDTRNHKLVCDIPGPGNMVLSIGVVHNKIIAGSKDKHLHSWQVPIQVRALLSKDVVHSTLKNPLL